MRSRFGRDLLVMVVGVALAATIFIGSLALAGSIGGGSRHELRALMPTVSSLTRGSRVTMAGAKVGQITKIERQGYGTLVTFEIRKDSVWPVASDSHVTLRQRTPVGENYLEVTPGRSPRALTQGATIPIGQSDEYVDVDQILSVLQGPARADARKLLQGTGGALAGQGERLNRLLAGGQQVVRHGASVLTLLSEDRRQVAGLVDRFGRLATAVGERGAAVQTLAHRGLRALHAVGQRDDAVAALLHELPSTLRQVRTTSVKLRGAATVATPVLREAAVAVHDLRPAIGDLRPAAQQGRNVVAELGRGAAPLTTLLGQARSASGPLGDALPQLQKVVCQVAPVLRYTRPYAKDLLAPVIGLGSASNSYDAIGHLVRLTPIVGENSLVGLPESVSKAAYTLLRTGLLGKSSPLTWDPYPEPNQIGKARAQDKPGIFGPKELGKSGFRFKRVEADC